MAHNLRRVRSIFAEAAGVGRGERGRSDEEGEGVLMAKDPPQDVRRIRDDGIHSHRGEVRHRRLLIHRPRDHREALPMSFLNKVGRNQSPIRVKGFRRGEVGGAMWAMVQVTISTLDYAFAAYGRKHFDRYTARLQDPRMSTWLSEAAQLAPEGLWIE